MLIAYPKLRSAGFSLIELMIGIIILAILASVAMPSFQVWLQNSQIRNAAESIQNGLQKARAEAVTRNTNVEFVLTDLPNSSWTVRVAGGDVLETRSAAEGSRNVKVDVKPFGTTTVTYNSLGSIQDTNRDGTKRFTEVNVDSAVLAPAESQDLRITLGLGGNVRMCDPNAPAGNPRACD